MPEKPSTPEPSRNDIINAAGDLAPYGETGRRLFAMMLMEKYVPSAVKDSKFRTITQGRAGVAFDRQRFFSTCGELAMFLLHALGYRGPCLNRTLLASQDGVSRTYVFGANMTYLVGRAQEQGHFVPATSSGRPRPGDICFIHDAGAAARSEHVFVFQQEDTSADNKTTFWRSYDAGQIQNHPWEQCAKRRARVYDNGYVDSRKVAGWLDISTLPLSQPATMFINEVP